MGKIVLAALYLFSLGIVGYVYRKESENKKIQKDIDDMRRRFNL